MNKETCFIKQVEKSTRFLIPGVVWCRHSEMFNAGVPDVEIALNGKTYWVEFKWSENHEAQVGKLLRPGQYGFLHARAKQNVPAYVAVGFPNIGFPNRGAMIPIGLVSPNKIDLRLFEIPVLMFGRKACFDIRKWLN